MHNALPVAPEQERLLVLLKRPKLLDYDEMIGINEAYTEKENNKEQKDEIKKRKNTYEETLY